MSEPGAHFVATRQHVLDWLERYERAWRARGTDLIAELFAEDATYLMAPFDPPIVGVGAIAEMWEREREGPDEAFTMSSEIVAVDDDIAVTRVDVHYERTPPTHYRDLWVIRFDGSGRCRAFEEWPFWPEQPRAVSRT